MKMPFSFGVGLLAVTMAVVTGCQTLQPVHPVPMSQVQPAAHERIILDQIYILSDASSSMQRPERFPEKKAFLQAFATAMPSGTYEAAASSFGGPDSRKWQQLPIHWFERGPIEDFADHLDLIGGTTDMHRWLRSWESDIAVREGRAAVLILSDGRAPLVETMLAVHDLAEAYNGQLCIFAVQFGDDPEGAWLLRELTRIARCGQVWNYDDVNSAEGIEAVVRRIFFLSDPADEPFAARDLFGPILFDFDRSEVRSEYHPLLDEVALIMHNHPAVRARIEGHTDSRGSRTYNQGLSERRAGAVKQELVQRGVIEPRMETVGFSLDQPVRPNDTPENRQQNRRVEIKLHR